ncbi:MAG TPA: cytochrome c family protein [Pseudolabrys sp.]|jgi:cytochrome c|nr:cytochrome c family protein [Pseudolabrys sp.]
MKRFALLMMLGLPAIASAQQNGDPAKGEQIFKTCNICHSVGPDAKIKVGPPLNGIVGRHWASWSGFNYSKGLNDGKAQGKIWDEANLNKWLENPRTFVPGTKMIFPGLKKEEQRADVIAYLKEFDINGKKK